MRPSAARLATAAPSIAVPSDVAAARGRTGRGDEPVRRRRAHGPAAPAALLVSGPPSLAGDDVSADPSPQAGPSVSQQVHPSKEEHMAETTPPHQPDPVTPVPEELATMRVGRRSSENFTG
jgi:hypothetical protein